MTLPTYWVVNFCHHRIIFRYITKLKLNYTHFCIFTASSCDLYPSQDWLLLFLHFPLNYPMWSFKKMCFIFFSISSQPASDDEYLEPQEIEGGGPPPVVPSRPNQKSKYITSLHPSYLSIPLPPPPACFAVLLTSVSVACLNFNMQPIHIWYVQMPLKTECAFCMRMKGIW